MLQRLAPQIRQLLKTEITKSLHQCQVFFLLTIVSGLGTLEGALQLKA